MKVLDKIKRHFRLWKRTPKLHVRFEWLKCFNIDDYQKLLSLEVIQTLKDRGFYFDTPSERSLVCSTEIYALCKTCRISPKKFSVYTGIDKDFILFNGCDLWIRKDERMDIILKNIENMLCKKQKRAKNESRGI